MVLFAGKLYKRVSLFTLSLVLAISGLGVAVPLYFSQIAHAIDSAPASILTLTVPATKTITRSALVPETSGGTPTGGNTVVDAATNGLTAIPVTLENTGDAASANVRISPINAGSHIQLWAKDTSNNWFNINVTGWIDSTGKSIPANSDPITTSVYAISDTTDDYPLTVNLVYVAGGTAATAVGTVTVTPTSHTQADFAAFDGVDIGTNSYTVSSGITATYTGSNTIKLIGYAPIVTPWFGSTWTTYNYVTIGIKLPAGFAGTPSVYQTGILRYDPPYSGVSYKMSTIGDGSTPLAIAGAAVGYLDYSFAANSNNTKKDGLVKLQVIWNAGDAPEYFTIDITGLQLGPDTILPTATVSHDEVAKTITYTFSEPVQLRDADGNVLNNNTYASSLAVYDSVAYLAHIPGATEPGYAVIVSSAILSSDAKSIVITYTGSLIKNADTSYVVDAWGKNITDLAGNKMAQNASQIFTVAGDNIPPVGGTLTMVTKLFPGGITKSPTNDVYSLPALSLDGADVFTSLNVEVTDANMDTTFSPDVYIDGNTSDKINGKMVYSGSGNTWNYNLASKPDFSSGTHSLVATFKDLAGNTKTLTATFTTDNTAPTATIDGVAPKAIYNGSTNINVHAIDDNYLKTDLYIEGGTSSFKTYTDVWFGLSWLGNGNYRMVVIDKAGNSTEYKFTIDKTTPTATVTYDKTTWTNGSVIATLNPSESVTVTNNSDNATYTFTDNGTFTFQFVDAAGNTGTALATVNNIDKVAPLTPTHISPADNSYLTTANWTLADWSDETDTNVPVTYIYESSNSNTTKPDGSFISPAYVSLALSSSQISTAGTSQGTYYWHVRSQDALGNASAWSTPWKVTVDNTIPVKPVFTAPANNLFTNVNSVTLMWSDGDDIGATQSGIKGYTIRYAFVPMGGGVTVNWTSNLIVSGNPKIHSGSYGHGQGTYTMYVSTTDNAGNVSPESNPLVLNYDATEPTIDAVTNITVEATSALGATVTIIPPMSHDIVDGDVIAVCDKTTGTFPLGITTVTCSKTDAAGNIATDVILIVTVEDTTKPTVVLDPITSPSGGSIDSINVTGTASDLVGVAGHELSIDGIIVATGADTAISYDWDISTLASGDYLIRLEATDSAGNLGSNEVTVSIDNTAPEVTVEDTKAPIITSNRTVTITAPVLARTVAPVLQQTTDREVLGDTDVASTPVVAVLGDQTNTPSTTTETPADVTTDIKGATDTKDENAGWSIFGLAWYWWLVILAAGGLIIWRIVASAIRNNDNQNS